MHMPPPRRRCYGQGAAALLALVGESSIKGALWARTALGCDRLFAVH